MTKLKKSLVEIFTDGSCSNKKSSEIKCGYGVHFYDININDISRKFTKYPLTNQRSELYAIYKGIKKVIDRCDFKKLIVYTDSKYSIGCLTEWILNWKKNGWVTANKNPVKNVDIIIKIDKILEEHGEKIFFEHVKAHTTLTDKKSNGNRIADELAVNGANKL
tara:strand:+ start:178 stop:666 length:489 start_codon:yes stop_codon:yes gene_type:complete